MNDDEARVFDGTQECFHGLFEWAGQRFPLCDLDGDRVQWVAVRTDPNMPMLDRAYPGDTIRRHPDGTLTVEHANSA